FPVRPSPSCAAARPRARGTAASAAGVTSARLARWRGVSTASDDATRFEALFREHYPAAERTAAFTSGEITWHTVHRPPVSDFPTDNVLVTRYDGRDSSTRFVSSGQHAGA